MPNDLKEVFAYHQATKHHFDRYARGPGSLDWATQPNPFRRYAGAALIPLKQIPPDHEPLYETAFIRGGVAPRPLDGNGVSQLVYDSLALSAWKEAGGARWSLRVNPSSGDLHPTEGYLICGPVPGLCDSPMVAHYAPKEHALEVRAEFPLELWRRLIAGMPEETVLIGLASVHWREAWKYGERAFRYCQHDAGHAIAAVAIAAAGMGWEAILLDDLGTDAVGRLLGVVDPIEAEPERPDCLLAVFRQGESPRRLSVSDDILSEFSKLRWVGEPNLLSRGHVDWPIIEHVALSTKRPAAPSAYPPHRSLGKPLEVGSSPIALRKIIHQRRSAVALDGRTGITRDAFYQILRKTLPGPGQIPFTTLPWAPVIHFVLFVHRVADLDAGLYLLVRDPTRAADLRDAAKGDFDWSRPEGCPEGMDLYRLATGDARKLSQQISCHQEIAADGCFSLGMLAEFEDPIRRFGPWFYPRLFWESGVVGQVLYLEAEASGIRGTGIGCFFDDPVHEVLGIEGLRYQSLYHFTMGGPIEDTRLMTLPAYPPPEGGERMHAQDPDPIGP